MRAALLSLSLLAMLAILGGCGGFVDDDGFAAAKYRLSPTGECLLPDGSACLFSSGEQPPGEETPPGELPPGTEPPSTEQLPPEKGGCWVTGIGTFGKGDTRDSFGGNGMTMKDGSVRGEWQHTDHFDESGTTNNGQNLFHGKVTYIACRKFPLPGPEVPKAIPNYANWGGIGRFNGVDGYYFDVKAFDHAEGGIHKDRYMIDIYDPQKQLVLHADGLGTMTAPSNKTCEIDAVVPDDLAWVKQLGCLSGGNFQIHPPNQGHPY